VFSSSSEAPPRRSAGVSTWLLIPGVRLATRATSRMMRCMSRKRPERRPPLDDTIARFERDLQRLALDLARAEIDRLRTIPLVTSGARAMRVPAMAPIGPRAVSSARRKRRVPVAPPAATFMPAPAGISVPAPMVEHPLVGMSAPAPKVERTPAVTEARAAARRRAAEPSSVKTEPAEKAVSTVPTSQTALAAAAPIGRAPATAGPNSGAASTASPPVTVRRATPVTASTDVLRAELIAAAVPAVPEPLPAAAARWSERALVQEPVDERRDRVRRRREERAERRRQRQERARQRRAAVVVRSEPAVSEDPRSPEAEPEAPGGAAIAVPRAKANAA
jgi:hypothetical protein